MNRKAIRTMVWVLLILANATVWADYESGQRAWESGRPAEALVEWQTAADEGDRRAMLALGRLYLQGIGVLQNYVEAHKWFNLAASRGEMDAVAERDALTPKMTAEERAEAQKRALSWQPGAGRSVETTPAATQSQNAGAPPPHAIQEAQQLLKALGYTPGPADGLWGKRTGRAHQAFLRDAGLPAADVLTPESLNAMRTIARRQGITAEQSAIKMETGEKTTARKETTKAAVRKPPAEVLYRTAKAGDIEGLKAALGAGLDVNARDSQGWTALMHVVNKGFTLMVPPLLEAKADLDMRAPDGATALFMAAVHGHSEIIALLMEAGADISIRGPKGKTASDVALARYGGVEAARQNNESAAVVALLRVAEILEAERLAREARKAAARRAAEAAAELEARKSKMLKALEEEMVVIPAGKFRMSSPKKENKRYGDEGSRHRVTISKSFAVGKHEVTRGQYAVFAELTGHSPSGGCRIYDGSRWKNSDTHSWREPGFVQGGDDPVVCVNWEDAQAFVGWLSSETGQEYRLLTESEWEYSARAGTTGPFHFGSTISTDQASYNGNYTYGKGRKGVNRKRTVPVGSFPSNKFGLHDMPGNVWEWVEDCWHSDYRGAPTDGSAWTSGGDCNKRVLRGGSWDFIPRNLRVANQLWDEAGGRSSELGFRVARTLTP